MIRDIYCPSCGHLMYKNQGGLLTKYTDYHCPCRNIRLRDVGNNRYMLIDVYDDSLNGYKIKSLSLDEWSGIMGSSGAKSDVDFFIDFTGDFPSGERCPYCNKLMYNHYRFLICHNCTLILKRESSYYSLYSSPRNDSGLEKYDTFFMSLDDMRNIYRNNAKPKFWWRFRDLCFTLVFMVLLSNVLYYFIKFLYNFHIL